MPARYGPAGERIIETTDSLISQGARVAQPVILSDEELEAILPAIEVWCEGFEDATRDVIADRSLTTPEELLVATDCMHRNYALCVQALHKLRLAARQKA